MSLITAVPSTNTATASLYWYCCAYTTCAVESSLSVDASPLDMAQRLEAIEGVLNWSNITPDELKAIEEEEDNVKSRIIFAREFLKDEVCNLIVVIIVTVIRTDYTVTTGAHSSLIISATSYS
jgi:hypothetical protein